MATATIGDSPITTIGTGGAIAKAFAVGVGFNPAISASSLIINGLQVEAVVTDAMTSAKLNRSIVEASTLTITLEDPHRALLNSPIAAISAPIEPITVQSAGAAGGAGTVKITIRNANGTVSEITTVTKVSGLTSTSSTTTGTPSALPTGGTYYPTTVALTDGTTTIAFALVSVAKTSNTVTLTFEDQLVNQLRYCWGTYAAAANGMTRADVMAKVINMAMASMAGNVLTPALVYPAKGALANPVLSVTNLVWGGSANPDQDAWSFLVQAANDAQWRCFSTGTAIVFGPDDWLMTQYPAATFEEFTGGIGYIDGEWDIGQTEASCTVNCFTGDPLTFAPGAVAGVTKLGVFNGLWLVATMARELHLADCTVTLAQVQPSLTEAQIAATNGTTSTVSGTNAAGQSVVPPAAVTTSNESAIAQKAVTFALKQAGKPYIWGGTGPGGYDCSGLTYKAYLLAGLTIPRTSQSQSAAGFSAIIPTPAYLIPGDLVFYAGSDGTASAPGHVVMYIGNGECIQAETTGTNIMATPLPAGAVGACRPAP